MYRQNMHQWSKTKFCFAPLMHVLSIHMKIIASMSSVDVFESGLQQQAAMGQQTLSTKIIATLSEEWGFLTGQLRNSIDSPSTPPTVSPPQNPTTSITASTAPVVVKQNKIPLLMQDPLAVLLHYVLLLPVNIDTGKHSTPE